MQVVETITEDSGRWNKSLAMLRREQEEAARRGREGLGDSLGIEKTPKSPPAKKNSLETEISKLLF